MNIWKTLGIPHGSDRNAIRRAYATKLRVTNPEDDPEGFKRLRAAYESALRHLEYQSWDDIDDDGEENETEGPITATDPHALSEPHQPGEPVLQPELDTMLAAREAELDALRTAMGALEKGLRGPWRPDDATFEGQLEAILRSPALGEIRIRTEVEPWLADLLAATIPHSDAVLLQSIQAFGWLDGERKRGFNPAIAVILGRLDEWRLIESLNRPSHVHHAAWRSLTRPPGRWWPWRIAAFKPGMIAGIEVFLGMRGQVARGLHYSYRKESVERWRRFLAKPRLTLGILALVPLAFLALFGLGTVIAGAGMASSAVVIGGMSAIAFATPFAALFLLSRWQRRWRERLDHPRWLSDGWLIAYIALPLVALAPPPYWPVIVILPAVAIAVWAYIVEPLLVPEPLSALPAILVGGFLCSVGTLAFWRLDLAQGFAISVMAALLVYFRLSQWTTVQAIAGRWWLEARREWFIFCVVPGGVAARLAFVARAEWHPVPAFYAVALVVAALLPLISALQSAIGGRNRNIAVALLLFIYFIAAAASVPDPPAEAPSTLMPRTNGVDSQAADA